MIEQGLVELVQSNPTVSAATPSGAGFFSSLPKDQPLPSWTYLTVSHLPNTTLTTVRGFAFLRLQIDCYGANAVDVITLAHAIDLTLHGFRGALPDPDSTYVDSCMQSDLQDFTLDEASRTFRRMLEYEIWYAFV